MYGLFKRFRDFGDIADAGGAAELVNLKGSLTRGGATIR